MKIKKFEQLNENVIFDKIWTKEKFIKFENLKDQIAEEENNLRELLHEFLDLNEDLLNSYIVTRNQNFFIQSFSYYPNNPLLRFEIIYEDEDNDVFSVSLNPKQFEDLLDFLKDSEMYKNSHEFNL